MMDGARAAADPAMQAEPVDGEDIPLLTGAQRQGDLIVLPVTALPDPPNSQPSPVPPDGVPLVRGEQTAHTHLLVGDATWTPTRQVLDLGVVAVTSAAYVLHPEHAALGLAAGRYLIRRQRELGFPAAPSAQPVVPVSD